MPVAVAGVFSSSNAEELPPVPTLLPVGSTRCVTGGSTSPIRPASAKPETSIPVPGFSVVAATSLTAVSVSQPQKDKVVPASETKKLTIKGLSFFGSV